MVLEERGMDCGKEFYCKVGCRWMAECMLQLRLILVCVFWMDVVAVLINSTYIAPSVSVDF